MVSIYSLAGLLSCTTAALAAVEAHNHLRSQVLSHPDSMSMQVWVDGRLVCDGVENVVLASNETTFCLRNHDGQGKGCAAGYAYCTWGNGQVGELEYFSKSPAGLNERLFISPDGSVIDSCRYRGFQAGPYNAPRRESFRKMGRPSTLPMYRGW